MLEVQEGKRHEVLLHTLNPSFPVVVMVSRAVCLSPLDFRPTFDKASMGKVSGRVWKRV